MMFAVVDDVLTALGRPTGSASQVESEQWLVNIARVQRIIVRRVPDLVVRTALPPGDLDRIDSDDVRDIIAEAVARKARNPDGKVSEGIDDYSYRLNESARKGDLFLTDEEWAALLPTSASGAFSTRPGFDRDRPVGWLL